MRRMQNVSHFANGNARDHSAAVSGGRRLVTVSTVAAIIEKSSSENAVFERILRFLCVQPAFR
jgi:hypothetical protein